MISDCGTTRESANTTDGVGEIDGDVADAEGEAIGVRDPLSVGVGDGSG